MVQINFAQKSVNLKVVYYGPGMSGKTTNLEVIHQRAPEGNRGDLTSISTDGDRTLFFDYMPLDLGTVAGMRTAFQLYTVPGQVYYNSTRKLVLQGVDGIIFVADSSASMVNQNLESLRNLEENLNEYGKSLSTLPHVIQLNKRDLPDAMTVEELGRLMNPHNAPLFEAIANTGQGVFPTLKALAASVLKNIMNESGQKATAPAPHAAPPQARPGPAPRGPAPARPGAPHAAPSHPQAPLPMHPVQPSYPPVGAPQVAGGGFFPGAQPGMAPAPMHGQQPMHAQHPQHHGHQHPQHQQHQQHPQHPQGGLQLAQPSLPMSQTRSQPRAALSVGAPRQAAGAPGPAPRPQARPAAAPAQAHAKPRAAAPKAHAAPAPEKPRGKLTPLFIVAGAGVGAVLAWVLLNVL
jgi:signal recognition particle receptor subunit beta